MSGPYQSLLFQLHSTLSVGTWVLEVGRTKLRKSKFYEIKEIQIYKIIESCETKKRKSIKLKSLSWVVSYFVIFLVTLDRVSDNI